MFHAYIDGVAIHAAIEGRSLVVSVGGAASTETPFEQGRVSIPWNDRDVAIETTILGHATIGRELYLVADDVTIPWRILAAVGLVASKKCPDCNSASGDSPDATRCQPCFDVAMATTKAALKKTWTFLGVAAALLTVFFGFVVWAVGQPDVEGTVVMTLVLAAAAGTGLFCAVACFVLARRVFRGQPSTPTNALEVSWKLNPHRLMELQPMLGEVGTGPAWSELKDNIQPPS